MKYVIPQICIALETVLIKLYTKLAPGWALIRVNVDPMQEIGQKVGSGHFPRDNGLENVHVEDIL